MAEMCESADVQVPESTPPPPPVQECRKDPIKLRISVFFDGTGNNRGNIQARLNNTQDYQLVKKQDPLKSKDKSRVIGTSAASFEADFSNVALMEEKYKPTDKVFHKAIYVEGAGTRDLKATSIVYEEQMKVYNSMVDNASYYSNPYLGFFMPPPRPKFKIDSDVGFSTATFATGIYQKIDAGFAKVMDWYQKLIKDTKITSDSHEVVEILVDVFGFSRGSATARTFIHHILEGQRLVVGSTQTSRGTKPVYSQIPCPKLRKAMLVHGVDIAEDAVKVDFVGLFDTVSSYKNALNSDVKALNQDAVKKARKVYHLAAAEEHRLCFSLTDISSAKNTGKGEEYFLPGAHSDIGGGYREEGAEVEVEDFEVMNHDSWAMTGLNFSSLGVNLKDYASMLEGEGWFNNRTVQNRPQGTNWQIRLNRKHMLVGAMPLYGMGMGGSMIEVDYSISVFRDQIKNTYRRIPLNLMVEEAQKNGLVFDGGLATAYKVPGELQTADSAIRSYIARIGSNSKAEDWFTKSSADLGGSFNIEDLRNRHLHYSAKIATGLWPRLKDGVRVRERYPG